MKTFKNYIILEHEDYLKEIHKFLKKTYMNSCYRNMWELEALWKAFSKKYNVSYLYPNEETLHLFFKWLNDIE